MSGLSRQAARSRGGALGADVFRGNEADAKRAMKAAGVKTPRCRCEDKGNEPWLYREEDGQLHCVNCGLDYRA